MIQTARRPNIEFTRKLGTGYYKSYGHIYFKPLIVVLFGKVIVGNKYSKLTADGEKDKNGDKVSQ